MKARLATDSAQERLEVVLSFLDEFPESRHTAYALFLAFAYFHELGRTNEGIEYIERIRSMISDPGIGYQVDRRLLPLYGEAGRLDKMLEVAEIVEKEEGLLYLQGEAVLRVAVQAGDWEVARRYSAKTRDLNSPDAFRAELQSGEMSEDDVAAEVRHRKGLLASHDGWIEANQGNLDQALASFAEAETLVRHSYLGIPDGNLNLNWGETLMMKADFSGAIERLAPEGLISGNREALSLLEDAYRQREGSGDGFETWGDQKRLEIAKTIDRFTLPDYQGRPHELDSLLGKVTLIAFWFPT